MTRETVLEELTDGVMLITLNRPEKKNAFNRALWRDSHDAMADALANDAVRAVVITGAGGAFTAGQDLEEMGSLNQAAGTGSGGDNGFGAFMDVLCEFDKPLIAAVEGIGVGLGITLLLHCDYVYIARGSRLRAPFVTLGVVPEAASSYLFAAVIGYRNATDLLFESDFIDAERAHQLGVATHLTDSDDLLEAAMERARHLALKPLGSLRMTKRLMMETRSDQLRAARAREDSAFMGRVGSPENIEAISAFLEKRPADFTNVPSHDRPRD